MSHSHVTEKRVIVKKAIAIVVIEAAEPNEKNSAVMIAIVVNLIGNRDGIDHDREVKTEKEQKEVDRENEKDPETEKKENDDPEVGIGKIVEFKNQ